MRNRSLDKIKIKQMNKKTLLLILSGILLFPNLTSALTSSVTVTSMVDAAEQVALYIASGVVVILWIVTGILFLSAQGAPEKLSSAKKALFAAVAGTVLVIVAGSAIAIVSQALNLGAQ
jgi:uncharacterized membrane protein (DUF485 family)